MKIIQLCNTSLWLRCSKITDWSLSFQTGIISISVYYIKDNNFICTYMILILRMHNILSISKECINRLDKINKRPKGPHIVHLSTMCHLFDRTTKTAIFVWPENTNLVHKNIEILLSVKFRWILFSSFREVKNVSANQRPGWPSCFFRSAWKTQTWKRTFGSCFLSSFAEFRSAVSVEKSRMPQSIRGQGGHLVFPISPKNTNW